MTQVTDTPLMKRMHSPEKKEVYQLSKNINSTAMSDDAQDRNWRCWADYCVNEHLTFIRPGSTTKPAKREAMRYGLRAAMEHWSHCGHVRISSVQINLEDRHVATSLDPLSACAKWCRDMAFAWHGNGDFDEGRGHASISSELVPPLHDWKEAGRSTR